MGQYYRPVSLDTMEHLNSHDYGCGMKLMEHSWIGNNFVEAVELLLIEGARWDKHKIVWAGDYADNEPVDSEWYKEERSNDKGEKISERTVMQDVYVLKFLRDIKCQTTGRVSFSYFALSSLLGVSLAS